MDNNKLNKNKILYKVVSKTFISRLVSAVGAILLSFLIAKFAGASELGVYTTVTTVAFALAIVGRFGLDSVLLVYGSIAINKGDINRYRKIKNSLFVYMSVGSFITGFVAIVFSENIAVIAFKNINYSKEILYLSLLILLYNIMYFQSACLKCLDKAEVSPLIEIGAMSFVACFLIMVLKIYSYEITVILCLKITIVAAVLVAFFGRILVYKYEKRFHSNIRIKETKLTSLTYFKEGWDHMTGNLVAFVGQWSALLILAFYVSTEEVGVFSMVQRLAMLTTFMLSIFNTISARNFAILSGDSDKNKLQNYVKKTTNIMFTIGLVVTSLIAMYSVEILGLFGNEFIIGWHFLILLNFGQLINVATGSVGTLLNMTGNQKEMKYLILVTCLISSTVAYLTIPTIGIMGAVIATFINLVLQNIVASYLAYKYLGIKTYPHY